MPAAGSGFLRRCQTWGLTDLLAKTRPMPPRATSSDATADFVAKRNFILTHFSYSPGVVDSCKQQKPSSPPQRRHPAAARWLLSSGKYTLPTPAGVVPRRGLERDPSAVGGSIDTSPAHSRHSRPEFKGGLLQVHSRSAEVQYYRARAHGFAALPGLQLHETPRAAPPRKTDHSSPSQAAQDAFVQVHKVKVTAQAIISRHRLKNDLIRRQLA